MPHLDVSWKVTVVRVVNVLSNSEDERIIEIVEFVVAELDVVLNAITVQIGDLSSMPSLWLLQECEILWTLNVVNEVSKSTLIAHLQVLIIAHVV